ncbi:hypothetical protein BH23PLA1_BH23PLA1_03260 [soil metagenome]
MPVDSSDLGRLQRWMQAVMTHPGGVVSGLGTAEARRHMDVEADRIESVITRSKAMGGVDRLEVYARAYYTRLLECLRAEYPILARAIGEDLFDEFAVDYLQHYPSRSYTLNRLGADFPHHLDQTRPPDEDWAAMLVDLARLEWAIGEVFDGPGIEGQRTLTVADLLAVPVDRWQEARLLPVPCLRTLLLRFPVWPYYTALRSRQDVTPPGPEDSFLALTRRDYVVRVIELSSLEHAMLSALIAGRPVGEAIGLVAEIAEADSMPGELEGSLRRWFHDWAASGFFLAVDKY